MVLGQTVFSGYFSLAVVFLVVRHVYRTHGMEMLLSGLMAYFCVDPTKDPALQAQIAVDGKSRKGVKKQWEAHMEQITVRERVVHMQRLHSSHMRLLPFCEDLDIMVMLILSILTNVGVVYLMAAVAGFHAATVVTSVSLLTALFITLVLFKTEQLTEKKQGAGGQVLMALCIALGAALAMGLLVFAPSRLLVTAQGPTGTPQRMPLLDFHLQDGTNGLNAVLGASLQRVYDRMGLPQPEPISSTALAGGMAVWAGVLMVCLASPAVRFARLIHTALQRPAWNRDIQQYLNFSPLATKVMQLACIAPLLPVLLQFQPLAAYWHLPLAWAPMLTACALLVVAATQMLALRSMCQAYLNTCLVEWFQLLWNSIEVDNKMALVRRRMDVIRVLLGRTAVQLAAVPLLSLILGLLLLLHVGTLTQVTTMATGPRQQLFAALAKTGVPLPGLGSVNLTMAPMQLMEATGSAEAAAVFVTDLQANYTTGGGAAVAAAVQTRSQVGGVEADMGHTQQQEQQAGSSAEGVEAQPSLQGDKYIALEGLSEDGRLVAMALDSDSPGDGATSQSKAATQPAVVEASAKAAPAAASAAGSVKAVAGEPEDFWRFVATFYGWWVCVVWCACCYTSLAVFKLGMHVS